MTMNRCSLLVIALAGILAMPATAADREQEYKDTIQKLLPGIAAEKIPDRQEPQQTLEKLCHEAAAPGREADRAALGKALMRFVGPESAKPARIWLLRKIEVLGGEEVVTGLVALLSDADHDVRETARRALANNPSEQAVAALRRELTRGGDPPWQAAVINALAWRRDAESTPKFIELARSESAPVASAAISALGAVGSEAAADALGGMLQNTPQGHVGVVTDACLRAAEQLAKQNKADAAVQLYQSLTASHSSDAVYIAALTGMARAQGVKAAPALVNLVKGTNVHARLVAARLLGEMGPEATPAVLSGLSNAPPAAKAVLVEVIGERRDPSAVRGVTALVEDADAEVRVAVLEALGKIGGEGAVDLLVRRAAATDGAEREAARTSLSMLRGQGVDAAVLSRLEKAEGPARIELLQAVWGRRIAAAKPLLARLAESPDEAVRVAVLNAMERLAASQDLPLLIGMLAKATSDAERKTGEQAVLSVCRRAGDPEAATPPIVQAMAQADPRGQVALLQALSRLQTPAALTAVRKATASSDPQVKKAALDALQQWKPIRITGWQYAGPFRKEGQGSRQLFETAFEPEQGGGEFKPLRARASDDGSIDLTRLPGASSNCCCYVRATIQSERARQVVLSVGSDDGIKIWLNGQLVHGTNVDRALRCDEEQVKVSLNEGSNTLLVKITQGGADWGFCIGVRAEDGAPPDGLRFESR